MAFSDLFTNDPPEEIPLGGGLTPAPPDPLDLESDPLLGLDRWLIEQATAEAYQVLTAAYDDDGVVTSAEVLWPDGSAGTFTTTTKNADFFTVDAFTLTHEASGKTVTQAEVTRNADGAVTVKPALTVS